MQRWNSWIKLYTFSAPLLSTVIVDALMEDNKFYTIFLFSDISVRVLSGPWGPNHLIVILIKRNRCLNHTVLLSQIHHYVNRFHSKYTWLTRRKQFLTDNISICSSQTKKQRSWESSEGFFVTSETLIDLFKDSPQFRLQSRVMITNIGFVSG